MGCVPSGPDSPAMALKRKPCRIYKLIILLHKFEKIREEKNSYERGLPQKQFEPRSAFVACPKCNLKTFALSIIGRRGCELWRVSFFCSSFTKAKFQLLSIPSLPLYFSFITRTEKQSEKWDSEKKKCKLHQRPTATFVNKVNRTGLRERHFCATPMHGDVQKKNPLGLFKLVCISKYEIPFVVW